MFNLLYKKYKTKILNVNYWKSFKELYPYEKFFLVTLIFDALLLSIFSLTNILIGSVITIIVLIGCLIVFGIIRRKPEEQKRILEEVIEPDAQERMKKFVSLLKDFEVNIDDDQQLDELIERAKQEQEFYDAWKDFRRPAEGVATYILLPILTLLLSKIFEGVGLEELLIRALIIFIICIIAVLGIYTSSSMFEDLFNKDKQNLNYFIRDVEDIKIFHNRAISYKVDSLVDE